MSNKSFIYTTIPTAIFLIAMACLANIWMLSKRPPSMIRPPSKISRENISMIKRGISKAEIESLMGGSARDETRGHGVFYFTNAEPLLTNLSYTHEMWLGPEWGVYVTFYEGNAIRVIRGQVIIVR